MLGDFTCHREITCTKSPSTDKFCPVLSGGKKLANKTALASFVKGGGGFPEGGGGFPEGGG